MSGVFYIETERRSGVLDTSVRGQALGSLRSKLLDRVCSNAGVESLFSFCSQDPEELAGMFGGDASDYPSELWFDADKGLMAIQGLRDYLRSSPDSIASSKEVIDDLEDYERVLIALKSENNRFRFSFDI